MAIGLDEKIDWFRVIVDLERSGYSHVSTAFSIGVAKRTVGGWKNGSRPRFEEGEKLLQLWSRVLGKGQESAPRVGRHSYRA